MTILPLGITRTNTNSITNTTMTTYSPIYPPLGYLCVCGSIYREFWSYAARRQHRDDWLQHVTQQRASVVRSVVGDLIGQLGHGTRIYVR